MPDKKLINKKLRSIALYLQEIKPTLDRPFKDFHKNYHYMRTAERDIQLIVDAAVDINIHILLEQGGAPPETNFGSFIEMEKLAIGPAGLFKTLAKSAGLRNKLVHEYEEIDPLILYRSLQKFIPLYHRYGKAIIQFISKK